MDGKTNYWKLGLFVVTGVALAVVTAFWLGAASLKEARQIRIVTYFNESVQGLTSGSAVRFRGVKIGEVESILVAGDMARLEVIFKVPVGALTRLRPPSENDRWPKVVGDLSAQLVSSSLTGQKYVDVDIASPIASSSASLPDGIHPPRDAELYIPSTRSTLKNVEDAVMNALEFFEGVGPDLGGTIKDVALVLREIRAASLPDEVRNTLAGVDHAVSTFHSKVDAIDTREIATSVHALIDETHAAVRDLRRITDSLAAEGAPPTPVSRQLTHLVDAATGVAERVQTEIARAKLPETSAAVSTGADKVSNAADAVADAAGQVVLLTDGLDATLLSLREAIDALRALIILLEHDPSSILRGRTYGAPPPTVGGNGDPP